MDANCAFCKTDPQSPRILGDDLNILKAVSDAARQRLGVPFDDMQTRQRIIKGLLELVSAGDRDYASLSLAIER